MTKQRQMYQLFAVMDDRPLVLGAQDGLVYLDTVEEHQCEKRVRELLDEADPRLDGSYRVWAHHVTPDGEPMSTLSSEGFSIAVRANVHH